MHGWLTQTGPDGLVHVLPLNDIRGHECSDACWCRPDTETDPGICSHNSLDRRELYEGASN